MNERVLSYGKLQARGKSIFTSIKPTGANGKKYINKKLRQVVTAGQVKGYTVSGLQRYDCHLPCLCSDATPVIPSGSAELAAG